MSNSENNNRYSDVHPLQGCVTNFIALAGVISTFMLIILTICSVYLVNNSAFIIHETLGFITLSLTIVFVIGILYIYTLITRSNILISSLQDGKRPLDAFTPIYLLLLLFGFVQIVFWVVDPESSIHEPRSVFIIAVAGTFAYIRRQYLISSSPKPPDSMGE